MTQHLTPLKNALRRLEKSATYQTRKNARLAVARAMRELDAELREQFPPMRPDGTLIALTKKRGVRCPFCKKLYIAKSYQALAAHLFESHADLFPCKFPVDSHRATEQTLRVCRCGKTKNLKGMSAHLIGVDKSSSIKEHVAAALLMRAAGLIP